MLTSRDQNLRQIREIQMVSRIVRVRRTPTRRAVTENTLAETSSRPEAVKVEEIVEVIKEETSWGMTRCMKGTTCCAETMTEAEKRADQIKAMAG